MAQGGFGQRAAALDAAITASANQLARRSGYGEAVVSVLAERLAAVEVLLMGLLLLAGRPRSVVRMLLAVTLVYAASEVLGSLYGRPRPFVSVSGVEALVAHGEGRSFPSRHVAAGLAMATIGYQVRPGLGRAMMFVAGLLGTTRVAAGLHYPSDVVAGAALGVLIARAMR